MKYVYLLRSIPQPAQTYVGLTANLDQRLVDHNAGQSPRTSRYKPWKCEVAIRFAGDDRAAEFERYLKSGSGRTFAKRHFW